MQKANSKLDVRIKNENKCFSKTWENHSITMFSKRLDASSDNLQVIFNVHVTFLKR